MTTIAKNNIKAIYQKSIIKDPCLLYTIETQYLTYRSLSIFIEIVPCRAVALRYY